MGRPATLRVDVVTDTRQTSSALRDSESRFRRWSGAVRGAALAAGAGIAAGVFAARDALNAAADEQQQIARLQNALDRLSDGYSYNGKAVADWIDRIKIGSTFADDDLRPALITLLNATDDLTTSQALLRASMDVAVASGKPLESVVAAVGKAANGQTTALGKLVPGLGAAASQTKNAAELQRLLERRFGGADAAASNTAAGGLQDLDDMLQDLKENVGAELLPVVQDFVDYLKSPEGQKALADTATAVGILARDVAKLAEAFVNAYTAASDFWNALSDGKGFDLPGWFPGGRMIGPDGAPVSAPWAYAATGGPATFGLAGSGRMIGAAAPTIVVQTLDPAAAGVAVRRALYADGSRRGAPVVIGRGAL